MKKEYITDVVNKLELDIGMCNASKIYDNFIDRVYCKKRNSSRLLNEEYVGLFKRYARMYLHKHPYMKR